MTKIRSFWALAGGIYTLGALVLGCGSGGSGSTVDDSCAMSFCGCSEKTTMTLSTTVQDAMTMMPLQGIELICFGEDTPITTSDANGVLSFSIETNESPGCGFDRCNNMKLHDPTGKYMDLDGTFFTLNGKTVGM